MARAGSYVAEAGSGVVSGIYDLANPTAALEAVVAPYGGRAACRAWAA
ncbi:hypothetical protein APY04_2660 [Hyphomicrobium sulfonivorans]|uniref:Uncharacterized protein n=1 Tax=Hyphomicrobium sulfonivorans TaxID=121290 RepID=A0A109BBM7_HYPSL|nr:hypothetical protein [Hyphomicrobium sulfonivorans]KWT65813.1 hypothetical protein APY04_2660 [Hyphomicrobium sulfonivorans]